MDRRTFLQASLSGLLTYNCSCARARATPTLHGCRMVANAGDPLGVTLVEPRTDMNRNHLQQKNRLIERFGVRPGMSYYDDGVRPNALADPRAIFPDGPDGTVLLGINFFDRYSKPALAQLENTNQFGAFFLAIHTIIAHEFGHIIQYKAGMSPTGPWQMEPHADFMAGWSLKAWGNMPSQMTERVLETAVREFFLMGDTDFNDRAHHGEPEFRAAMVRAGYESGNLDVNKAFDEGKKFAGLS
jgi:hypothetical protein